MMSSNEITELVNEKDEIIEVPLGEYIEACRDDTPAAVCREKDVSLKAGDIVELRVKEERVGQPWRGFDTATIRFFKKALTYDLTLAPRDGEELKKTVTWSPPSFHPTPAGTVGLVTTEEAVLNFDASILAHQLTGTHDLKQGVASWIRHGAVIRPSPKVAKTQSGKPANRRRVVLPPPRR